MDTLILAVFYISEEDPASAWQPGADHPSHRMRMAGTKPGLPLHGQHVLSAPPCSSILFLSRRNLFSEACATCDCELLCKCDGNVGKDVRLVSAHINWGEPGKYFDV